MRVPLVGVLNLSIVLREEVLWPISGVVYGLHT